LWEDPGGTVVSVGGHTAAAAGVARVGPVYTPPPCRRRGYGAAVTAYVTQLALDSGADGCMLYTDLANPTSNAIYQEIGYRPLGDVLQLRFVRDD
jgi:predicted GNAT family acetyltransferase